MAKVKNKDAYDFVCFKRTAHLIKNGEQTVLYKMWSEPHVKEFFNDVSKKEFKDYEYLHLHDAENTWFLDAEVDYVSVLRMHHSNAEAFHQMGDTTLDRLLQESESRGYTEDETEFVFCLPIIKVINTNL